MRSYRILIVSTEESWLDDRVRSRWSKSRLLTRLLALLIFTAGLRVSSAQSGMTPREADQELNASYQEAIRTLTPGAREKLRKAQRAWLVFIEKNSAAMRMAAQPLRIPSSRCQEVEVKEVANRSMDFGSSNESNAGAQLKAHFQRVDADLNAVYERCLTLLPPAGKAALRDAQRAWIEYRDANAPFGVEFIAGLTVRRADQLTEFYVESTTAKGPPKTEPPPPDPFERAR
jgi:uncharacterized protein YecT (DUF1311 family)